MFWNEVPVEPATETMSEDLDSAGEEGTTSDAKQEDSKAQRKTIAWEYDLIANEQLRDDRSNVYHSEAFPETNLPPQEHMMGREKRGGEKEGRNWGRNTSA